MSSDDDPGAGTCASRAAAAARAGRRTVRASTSTLSLGRPRSSRRARERRPGPGSRRGASRGQRAARRPARSERRQPVPARRRHGHRRPAPRQRHLPRRRHGVPPPCGVRRELGSGYAVSDVGSLNGTYVNRHRIDEAAARRRRRGADRQVPAGLLVGPPAARAGSRDRRGAGHGRYLSIGEVLGQLRPEFPDVTISKIRFLESEGLVEPQRTSVGLPQVRHDDDPAAALRPGGPARPVPAAAGDQGAPGRDRPRARAPGRRPAPVRGCRWRWSRATGSRPPSRSPGTPSELRLSREPSCSRPPGSTRSSCASSRATVWSAPGRAPRTTTATRWWSPRPSRRWRVRPRARHLRAFRSAADREVGLVEQVVAPHGAAAQPGGQARADEVVRELSALSVRLHAALVKAALGDAGRR